MSVSRTLTHYASPRDIVYYEAIKRELNKRLIYVYECRCDERLKAKTEKSTRLTYTVLCGGLEHPKDRDEVNKREVCAPVLTRMFVIFDLSCEENVTRW
jgi:hypothetical protein